MGWAEFFDSKAVLVISIVSVVCCLVSAFGAAWAVRRLPADYLLRDPAAARGGGRVRKPLRNALGALLLVLGVAMLVLPGQGLLTMVAALAVMDFRSKHRAERWLMLRPRVFAAINHFRLRSGRPALLSPRPTGPSSAGGRSPGSAVP
jgi:hypothetical protein